MAICSIRRPAAAGWRSNSCCCRERSSSVWATSMLPRVCFGRGFGRPPRPAASAGHVAISWRRRSVRRWRRRFRQVAVRCAILSPATGQAATSRTNALFTTARVSPAASAPPQCARCASSSVRLSGARAARPELRAARVGNHSVQSRPRSHRWSGRPAEAHCARSRMPACASLTGTGAPALSGPTIHSIQVSR